MEVICSRALGKWPALVVKMPGYGSDQVDCSLSMVFGKRCSFSDLPVVGLSIQISALLIILNPKVLSSPRPCYSTVLSLMCSQFSPLLACFLYSPCSSFPSFPHTLQTPFSLCLLHVNTNIFFLHS